MKLLFITATFLSTLTIHAQNIVSANFESDHEGFLFDESPIETAVNCGPWIGDNSSLSSTAFPFEASSNFLGFNMESGCGSYQSQWYTVSKKIYISKTVSDITISLDYNLHPDNLGWAPSAETGTLNLIFSEDVGMGAYHYEALPITNGWEKKVISIGNVTGDGDIYEGNYTLEFVLAYSAVGIDNISVDVGLEPNSVNEKEVEVDLFPNPTNGQLTVNADFDALEITNTLGETVYQQSSSFKHLNVANLPPGTYFMRVFKDSSISVQPFVKY